MDGEETINSIDTETALQLLGETLSHLLKPLTGIVVEYLNIWYVVYLTPTFIVKIDILNNKGEQFKEGELVSIDEQKGYLQ
jgi:hypothetical protein